MNNIDPYNNAPPPRKGGGSCGAKPAMNHQYNVAPMQQQQQIPIWNNGGGRTSGMTQRPMQTPGRPDLQTENQLLMDDLQVAIQYIQQLGGTWPPPGH